ncbi:Outer membrane lipoprotein Blc [Pararobbsia alpina]|uniref:lipocalin family protein n=1 Tax=Pararobbsia alpina TaxID=621374 RepID=UPI0039A5A07A
MRNDRKVLIVAGAALIGAAAIARCWCQGQRRVGNRSVPEPSKPIDVARYLGRWYEFARYENRFEEGDDWVTAFYALRSDGLLTVVNRGRHGPEGSSRVAKGRAKIVSGSRAAKLKVSFFGPFFLGDYWILDRSDDYDWSIVGEPSGKYLWILTREPVPSIELGNSLIHRVAELGYDTSLLRRTRQTASAPVL